MIRGHPLYHYVSRGIVEGSFNTERDGRNNSVLLQFFLYLLKYFVDSVFGAFSSPEAKLGRVQKIVLRTELIYRIIDAPILDFSQIGQQGDWPINICGFLTLFCLRQHHGFSGFPSTREVPQVQASVPDFRKKRGVALVYFLDGCVVEDIWSRGLSVVEFLDVADD